VFRRQRASVVPPPDPALMRLVETTGATARAAADLPAAIAVVLSEVAGATGWTVGHAWVPAGEPGAWVSSGLWFPDDGIGLGALRRVCAEAPPAPARGHLALALHLEGTQWVGDLAALAGTPMHDAAVAAGVAAAVACPAYAHGRPVALLEWYLPSTRRPGPDVAHVLGHLAGVLAEVAERPPVTAAVPAQRSRESVRDTLRWVTEDGVLSRLTLA
jgi:hypothetical protein